MDEIRREIWNQARRAGNKQRLSQLAAVAASVVVRCRYRREPSLTQRQPPTLVPLLPFG
jgi:hypothetical protein